MKVLIVRHGETDWNLQEICQGWSENPLNAAGFDQARDNAVALSTRNVKYIYSSPLLRTRQTAEVIAQYMDMPILFDDRLGYHFGDFTGQKKCDIPADILHDFNNNPHKYNADTFQDIYNRMKDFIEELKVRCIGLPLVVTHGINMNLLRYIASHPDWDEKAYVDQQIRIDNGTIMELDF